MSSENDKLTRIGVFYDGGYFQAISDYYKYHHDRRARISLKGLHEFAANRVASEEASTPGTAGSSTHIISEVVSLRMRPQRRTGSSKSVSSTTSSCAKTS